MQVQQQQASEPAPAAAAAPVEAVTDEKLIGLVAYLLWEEAGSPDGADFGDAANALLAKASAMGMPEREISNRVESKSQATPVADCLGLGTNGSAVSLPNGNGAAYSNGNGNGNGKASSNGNGNGAAASAVEPLVARSKTETVMQRLARVDFQVCSRASSADSPAAPRAKGRMSCPRTHPISRLLTRLNPWEQVMVEQRGS